MTTACVLRIYTHHFIIVTLSVLVLSYVSIINGNTLF